MYLLQWHDIDFKVGEAKKANGIEDTSRWFQISCFSRVAECDSLREIEAEVNLLV